MTDNNAFERFVADHLQDDGSGFAQAERLATLIDERTRGRRQLPLWLALIKEPPMRANNQLTVGSPTTRVAMIVVATVMLAVALAAVGAGAQRLLAGSEIIVSQDGTGDHLTISEAVQAASDGDKILVRPGTYSESIGIDKSIRLRGDGGRDAVTIIFSGDAPGVELSHGSEDDPEDPLVTYSVPAGIQIAADDVELSGLTITGPRSGVAIAVNAGTTRLGDLAISLESADGEEAADPAQDTRIGVLIAGDAVADLSDSTLDVDVLALEGGTATVGRSVLASGGIWGDPGSHLEAHDNVLVDASIGSDGEWAAIVGNSLQRGFISVGGDGIYHVTNNHIDGLRYDVGPGIAISVWDAGDVDITGNTVTNSDTGIKLLFFGGSALIDGNTLESTRTGISVGGGKTTVSDNVIEAADIIGLEVFNAGPTLTGNSITGSGTGLHLATTGAAAASGNTICDNRVNVRVVSGELPDLTGNAICEDGTD